MPLLWPLFRHFYLDILHSNQPNDAHHFLTIYKKDHEATQAEELEKLQKVTQPEQLKSEEWVVKLRDTSNKATIILSSFAHDRLIAFLTECPYLHVYLNKFIHIEGLF